MAKEQNDAQGVLIVDKPEEWTSHDVVAKLRGHFKIKKISTENRGSGAEMPKLLHFTRYYI